jgi:hypothetical protein
LGAAANGSLLCLRSSQITSQQPASAHYRAESRRPEAAATFSFEHLDRKGLVRSFIYILRDPRTYAIRYLGATMNPRARLCGHIALARSGKRLHVCSWIRSLLSLGLKPVFEIIEECDPSHRDEREIFYINRLRSLGYPLTNQAPGGEGGATRTGTHHSTSSRDKISRSLAGRTGATEKQRRSSAANLKAARAKGIGSGLGIKTQFKQGQVAWNKGRQTSAATRDKMRQAALRRYRGNCVQEVMF